MNNSILKIKLLMSTIFISTLLVLMLCLGSQNLKERYDLNFGVSSLTPLPTGFLVGIAISLGMIGGGSAASILVPSKIDD